MKTNIEFDLNNPEELEEYNCINQAKDLTLAMWTFLHDDIRGMLKYNTKNMSDEQLQAVETLRDVFIERLEEYKVDLEVLS